MKDARSRLFAFLAPLLAACVGSLSAHEAPYQFREFLEQVHQPGCRDASVRPAADEFVFTDGCRVPTEDFADYLKTSMNVSAVVSSDVACVNCALDPSLPARTYTVDVTREGVRIVGADRRACDQALYHLEDLMNLRRAPFLKFAHERRRMRYSPRMLHSGWGMDRFPDRYLMRMAHYGYDAVLVFVKGVGETQGEGRDADISGLIRRAKAVGIDVYLYAKLRAFVHPSAPNAKEVFDGSYGRLAAAYPEARGIVLVGESCEFPSKDPRTSGRSYLDPRPADDRRPDPAWFPCSDYPDWIRAVRDAVKARSPKMEIVFWTYNWGYAPEDECRKVLKCFPEDVVLNLTCHRGARTKHVNGFVNRCDDYTISIPGPSEATCAEVEFAQGTKRPFYMMANTGGLTWDFGCVPYEPFPFQWKVRWESLDRIRCAGGLSGLMESHHFGWYPNFVSELAKEAFTEGGLPFDAHLRAIAARDFGESNAEAVVSVWKDWSAAIADYPATDMNEYGPFRLGPAYPFAFGGPGIAPRLGEEPAPADSLRFPVPERATHRLGWMCNLNYTNELSALAKSAGLRYDVKKELELLGRMRGSFRAGADVFARLGAMRMETIGRYLQRTTETAINVKTGCEAFCAGDREALLAAARKEHDNARAALDLVERDSRLGWEPSMEYAGGPEQIRWKLSVLERLYPQAFPVSVTAKGADFAVPLKRGSDGEWTGEEIEVRLSADGRLTLKSPKRRLMSVEVAWKVDSPEGTRIFADAWERTGGRSGWFDADDFNFSPWFTLVRRPDGAVDGYGVKVQPNALVCWKAGDGNMTAVLDVSAGGRPLNLGDRTLTAAEFVFRRGVPGEDAFSAGQEFCRTMCPRPRLPKAPVYGYNDWYCAYGKQTATNFIADASFVCSLAEGLENRPYVVMDDGWQPNSPPVVAAYNPNGAGGSGYGPWNRSGDAFGMKMDVFASRVKALGAKPGLWYRPYCAWPGADRSLTLKGNAARFDPTNPKVREAIRADVRRFRDWGFDLVKIDYLTADLCGLYALTMGDRVFHEDCGWADDTRTSAEVILDLHRAMREAAGDGMVIIGCNALNHLVAGLFEVQRTGDDTSGWAWWVTRDKGVNTLATRAIQDRTFFLADADCVGLARQGAVPWEKNRQWLDLISRSGTPLFISWHRSLVDDEIRAALTAAFRRAAVPREVGRPVDWFGTRTPRRWRFADGEADYDWSDVSYAFTRVEADVSALPDDMRFVAGLFAERVAERTPPSGAGAAFKVRYAIDPKIKGEDARVDVNRGEAVVCAGGLRGLLFGTGNLLKSLTYREKTFSAVDGSFDFRPAKSLRIAYLARHFLNPYMEASAEEMCRYIDDLALDGINTYNFQIRMPAVDIARSDDREKTDFLRRSRTMVARVRRLGLALVGDGGSNQLPMDSPEAFRAAPNRNPKAPPTGFNACPAKPQAFEALMRHRRESLAELADVQFDYLVNWPYDEGGCGCDKCHPWGCNGYLEMCRKYRAANVGAHRNAKTILSTWFFTDEEYAGLWDYLKANDWIDYLMVDDFGTDYPKYPREHPLPGKAKIITFPEISMWGRTPWGGYGAIALPQHLKRLFRQSAAIAEGFEYYSEGFYEDINKAVVTSLYVDPGMTLKELLSRYSSYHFAGADPADFVRLAFLLEDNHRPTFLRGEKVEEAVRLARKMDAEILPSLRNSWRWRIVLLRTLIDSEIFRTGSLQPAAARPYFDELVKIYHAERQIDWILEGRMGGWTSPRYLPAGRRFKNHFPPAGDATGVLQKLVDDPAFVSVRLGRGVWKVDGDVRLSRSRFELVLEDGCRLETDGAGRLTVGEGVDGVTVRGEGRAFVGLPLEIVRSKNVSVKGIVASAENMKLTQCEDVRVDLSSESSAAPSAAGEDGLRRLDRSIEWADQHLEQEKVERLRERLERMKDESGWGAASPASGRSVFRIDDFGARTDGSNCRSAIQAAVTATTAAGGGCVVVPAGRWRTGAIRLADNIDLHLEKGASLIFSDVPEDYLPQVETSWEGAERKSYSPLVYAPCATNVSITGEGALCAEMDFWRTQNVRPHFIQFYRCRDVKVEGVTVFGSPFWTIHLYRTDGAVVRNVRVDAFGSDGKAIRNSDGIDVERSRNVIVEGCTFRQGDDAIVVKSGRETALGSVALPCENIVIRGCTVTEGHVLLGIGSEVSCGVRNVLMTNCCVDAAVNRLFFVKTNPRRGGFVENVVMADVKAREVREDAVAVLTRYFYGQPGEEIVPDPKYTAIRGLTVRNVSVEKAKRCVRIAGDIDAPVRDVHIENLATGEPATADDVYLNAENVCVDGLDRTCEKRERLSADF